MRALALTLALVACGGGDDSRLDQLCDESTGIVTRYLVTRERCSARMLDSDLYPAAYQADYCRGYYAPLLAAGTITVDDAAINACAAQLDATTCRPETLKDWSLATRVCGEIALGTLPIDASCYAHLECDGDAYCSGDTGCGTCTAKRGNGAYCAESSECSSGLCAKQTCVVRGGAGSTCSDDIQCGTGLVCRAYQCSPAGSTIGLSCGNDGDCGIFQASCLNGQCVPLAGTNAACSPWGQTATAPRCRWFANEGCIAQRCQPQPVVGSGASCAYDLARCDSGLACMAGTCKPLVAEGEPCASDDVCGDYAMCVDHVCAFSDYDASCSGDGDGDPGSGGGSGGGLPI